MVFFNVRVSDPNAKRYSAQSLQSCYINNEKEKKRQENSNGSLAPLVEMGNG